MVPCRAYTALPGLLLFIVAQGEDPNVLHSSRIKVLPWNCMSLAAPDRIYDILQHYRNKAIIMLQGTRWSQGAHPIWIGTILGFTVVSFGCTE